MRWVPLLQAGAFIGDGVLHSLHESSRCFGGNCLVLGVGFAWEFPDLRLLCTSRSILKTLLKKILFFTVF